MSAGALRTIALTRSSSAPRSPFCRYSCTAAASAAGTSVEEDEDIGRKYYRRSPGTKFAAPRVGCANRDCWRYSLRPSVRQRSASTDRASTRGKTSAPSSTVARGETKRRAPCRTVRLTPREGSAPAGDRGKAPVASLHIRHRSSSHGAAVRHFRETFAPIPFQTATLRLDISHTARREHALGVI